jgi:hypothetical protein
MRHRGRRSQFISSPSSLSLVAHCSVLLFVSHSLTLALVLPESKRDPYISAPSYDLLPRAATDAETVGPGLIADLTLSTGVSIGCVAAAYVGVLALVGTIIASLSPIRKRALVNGIEEAQAAAVATKLAQANAAAAPLKSPPIKPPPISPPIKSPTHAPNFSYPSPRNGTFAPNVDGGTIQTSGHHQAHLSHSSICLTPTSDPLAERQEVMESRSQAHEQLADLYKLVLQQDEERAASQNNSPQNSNQNSPTDPVHAFSRSEAYKEQSLTKRNKAKPASLSLDKGDGDKRKSKGSALLSALLSPKRKSKGLSISSPLMTPMSAAMSHHETQEMHPLSPRHYIPMPPPPVPTGIGAGMDQYVPDSPRTIDARMSHRLAPRASKASFGYQEQQYTTEEQEEEQEQEEAEPEEQPSSIEGRLGLPGIKSSGMHGRRPADINVSPISIESHNSQTPLVGLPLSPKPGSVRFSGLPQSPKPGATFQSQISTPRSQTAVRTNGALALRAYEPSGDAVTSLQYKQTVFERTGMLSPASPGTAVPYTPYQPFTPCIPMTPSLVTKQDRKRMKKLEPKTPTVEMVQSSEEIW